MFDDEEHVRQLFNEDPLHVEQVLLQGSQILGVTSVLM